MVNARSGFRQKPPEVIRAMRCGDVRLLSELGKKGAAASALNRTQAAVLEQEFRRLLFDDACQHADDTRPGWDDDYKP